MSRTTVHSAINSKAATAFSAYPVVYGNTVDGLDNSVGTVSYVKVTVNFSTANQFELGSPSRARVRGVVLFTLHVRRGKGDGDRNVLETIISDNFRGKQIGGATFLDMKELPRQKTENWVLTGVQVPFYFDEV